LSANICRDTATPAIWKVTKRQWLTTFAPILISRLVSPRLRRLGHRQGAHEVGGRGSIREDVELETHGVGGEGAA
jgi:hypothetical protein